MKTAINRWAFPGAWSYDEVIAATHRHGFDGLELTLEEQGELSLTTTPADAAALADRVRAAGLSIPAIATGLYWSRSLSAPDETERQNALALARHHMRIAAAMHVTHLLVVPGAVDVFFLPDRPSVPYEVVYQTAQRSLHTLAAEAEAHRLVLCIENVWNRFLMSPLEFRRFVDEIDSLLVRVYFDVGNVFQFGQPDDWIRLLGHRISRVHVKDFKRSVGTAAGFCGLGEGEIPWPRVMTALAEINYDGWLTAEVFPPKGSEPNAFLERTSRELKRLTNLGERAT
jgi:hexulose-6-phosphate isomerase